MAEILIGQTVAFAADPFVEGPGAMRHDSRGAVLVAEGRIAALGRPEALRAARPDALVTDYGDALISAGFIDAHVHYPQTAIIASWVSTARGRRPINSPRLARRLAK